MNVTPGRIVMFTADAGATYPALVVAVEHEPGDRVPRLILAVFMHPFWVLNPFGSLAPVTMKPAPIVGEVANVVAPLLYVRGVVEGVGPMTWAWPERAS